MTAVRNSNCIVAGTGLYVAFEMSWGQWVLMFSTGLGCNPRRRSVKARDLDSLAAEIAQAKARFQLPATAPVFSCYEAGRDGFWLHRWLTAQGVHNLVVDPASIEGTRRYRRAKTDRLDALKLLGKLLEHHLGERQGWKVVQVPSLEEEDQRQTHRDVLELKAERTLHVNRIKGLLATQGIDIKVTDKFAEQLESLCLWDGGVLPEALRARLAREFQRWQLVEQQLAAVEQGRKQEVRVSTDPGMSRVRQLLGLKGIGLQSAWMYSRELFGWRRLRNRRQVGALAGLTPTPWGSGSVAREQGIGKAGNWRVRALAIEIAWCWTRYQPDSKLTRWFFERFGKGGKRHRRIGIVAVARKLLIDLWQYLEHGEVPEGAVLVDWQGKV